jgi:hypothetical protein
MHVPQPNKMFLSEEMASFIVDIRAAYEGIFNLPIAATRKPTQRVTCGAVRKIERQSIV